MIFFHPDYTVGFGISPNLRPLGRGCSRAFLQYRKITAGREFHPALKIISG